MLQLGPDRHRGKGVFTDAQSSISPWDASCCSSAILDRGCVSPPSVNLSALPGQLRTAALLAAVRGVLAFKPARLSRRLKMLRMTRPFPSLRSVGRDAARRCRHTGWTNDLIENMDKKATWDRFYAENSKGTFKNFEWFFGFHAIKDCILPLLQTVSTTDAPLHVLDIGCGTSALGPCIYRHSECAVKVTCADISPVAVQLMQEHAENMPVQPCNPTSTLVFQELDCIELVRHFGPKSLALIVDKGTTDALVRSKKGQGKAGQIIRQCLKVLRPSGNLLQFSDEDPDARLLWLEKESRGSEVAAEVGVHEIGEIRGVTYFCYQISPRMPQH